MVIPDMGIDSSRSDEDLFSNADAASASSSEEERMVVEDSTLHEDDDSDRQQQPKEDIWVEITTPADEQGDSEIDKTANDKPDEREQQDQLVQDDDSTVIDAANNEKSAASVATELNLEQENYPTIKTEDEYERYIIEFNRDYQNYLNLYHRLKIYATDILQYRHQLRTLPISELNADRRKDLRMSLKRKYHDLGFGNDDESKSIRQQYEKLSKKIWLIKKRVNEYDQNRLSTS